MSKAEELPTWKDLLPGCVVIEPGSASQYKTGDWRAEEPLLDRNKCNKCGLCYIFCPDMCYELDDEGYYIANLYYCKGCGICAQECPPKAISMVEVGE